MEIVLNKDDIESLIKKEYGDYKSIKFNTKNLKISLVIDAKLLVKHASEEVVRLPSITQTPTDKPKPKNVMSTGKYTERAMVNI